MATEVDASQRALNVERWIVEARGGNRAALERLLEAYSPYLFTVANREFCVALRCRLHPGDVVQETLMKAWRHFPDFRGATEADWLAWLRQILRHHLANERRAHLLTAMRSIQREVSLTEAAAMPHPDDAGNESESPDGPAQAHEQQEMLEGALRRLPKHYRQVLLLHTQDELTFAQVGQQLHCSAEAARKLWRRAAEKLARLLKDVRKS